MCVQPLKKKEAPCDTIIRVDRSIRPTYPELMDKLMNPELESMGPNEYDLAMVTPWLHPKQEHCGVTTGQVIFDYLRNHDMLKWCLGLQDALEIKKLGVAVFQRVFGNEVVCFWKSVVRMRSSDGHLFVPLLCVHSHGVVRGGCYVHFLPSMLLEWICLGDSWFGNYFAALLRK